MTIDKFGRHIHKHIVKKHISSVSNTRYFLSQPITKEIILRYIQDSIKREAAGTTKHKLILSLYSDGTLDKNTKLFYIQNKGNQTYYINKLYSGNIVQTRYYENSTVTVQIDKSPSTLRIPGKSAFQLHKNDIIKLKYTGPDPTPEKTQPFFVEILLEEDVTN